MNKILLLFFCIAVLFSCKQNEESEKDKKELNSPYSKLLKAVRQNDLTETQKILKAVGEDKWREMGVWDSAGMTIYHIVIQNNSLVGFHGLMHYSGVPGIHEPMPEYGPAPIYALKSNKFSHVCAMASEKIFYPISLNKRSEQVWQDFYSDLAEIVSYHGDKYFWVSHNNGKHLIGYSYNSTGLEPILSIEFPDAEILAFEDLSRAIEGPEICFSYQPDPTKEDFVFELYSNPLMEKPQGGRLIFKDVSHKRAEKENLDSKYFFFDLRTLLVNTEQEVQTYQYFDGQFQKVKSIIGLLESKTTTTIPLRENPAIQGEDSKIGLLAKEQDLFILEKGRFDKVLNIKGDTTYVRWVHVYCKGLHGWVPNNFLEKNIYSVDEDSLYFDIFTGYLTGDFEQFKGIEFVMALPENYSGEKIIKIPGGEMDYGSFNKAFLSPSKRFLVVQGCDEVFGAIFFYDIETGKEIHKSENCDDIAFSGSKLVFWELTNETRQGEEVYEQKHQEVVFENGTFALTGRLRWQMVP